MADYKKIGFKPADILLPKNTDMTAWSVVACDQYTSQPEYWAKVKNIVGDKPSTLNIIFPEIYLSEDNSARIDSINRYMKEYLENGLFEEYKNSFVYVERTIGEGKVRRGLIGAIDLEAYDFTADAKTLVRATEGTVRERIPPRVQIRIGASIESPHIMVLIDDEKKNIIEKIDKKKLPKLYDFDLMMGGGHIEGYLVTDTDEICNKLEKMVDAQGANPLLFAMGDGNHSLATAKTCWEQIKSGLSESERENHPARYALAEIVNIHDSSMEFEPIHRVVFNVNPSELLSEFMKAEPSAEMEGGEGQRITAVYGDKEVEITVKKPSNTLEVGTLQKFLDDYVRKTDAKIDYIHGSDVVKSLAKESDRIGFILPSMKKSDLFPAIKNDGVLPRKTFSIGEAFEKRFYLECRKIVR
ncbi:MAG: DUF1015 domain-containing protein [Ruminococcaceae bacterium]|nr:DUF1015 domain-containing protein [Oscillospiraceae bacterium]